MPGFVAFDLDHTLLDGDSDYMWGEYLVEKNILSKDNWAEHNRLFYQQYHEGSLRIREYLRMAFGVLKPYSLDQLREWREDYFQSKVRPLFRPKALNILRECQEQNDVVIIITATNRFIASPSAEYLRVENLIASEAEFKDDKFTGEFLGIPSYRDGKVVRMKQWLEQNNYDPEVDLKKFSFYTDSHNDVFLMEEVGEAIAVNPDDKLKKIAKEKQWTILDLNS